MHCLVLNITTTLKCSTVHIVKYIKESTVMKSAVPCSALVVTVILDSKVPYYIEDHTSKNWQMVFGENVWTLVKFGNLIPESPYWGNSLGA